MSDRPNLDVLADATVERLPQHEFFVVGVGASAGGLDALVELTRQASLDTLAFVVVQHLARDHDSLLTQLLARTSSVDVVTAVDGMAVTPGRVFVIPPSVVPTMEKGMLRLAGLGSETRATLPIDHFLRSLARDRGPAAIAVILSGTGTDGTLGIEAIRAAGGLTFVQDPVSAKYEGMPRSALASGHADACLPPRQIAEQLARIGARPVGDDAGSVNPVSAAPAALAAILALIHATSGVDLTCYKPPTIERRLIRRMRLHEIADLDAYLRYVESNPAELDALYRDMLLTVTSFFRDHDVFEALKALVLPRLLEAPDTGRHLRIWVPACATGEEAYSIAIILVELLEERTREVQIQIFATDIDDRSVSHARRAIYAEDIALDVSPERLQRFFVKTGAGYQICRRIRDLVRFSRHDLLADVPFSRLGLVSCRNLLIYLQPPVQQSVLGSLHYALAPGGFLLLGRSETAGDRQSLFALVDGKNKIYARKESGRATLGLRPRPSLRRSSAVRPVLGLDELADRMVLELYGPPGVVIDEHADILRFRGNTSGFFNPASGVASVNLFKLARGELHGELRRTIHRARTEGTLAHGQAAFVDGEHPVQVAIEVAPLDGRDAQHGCLIVLFRRSEPPLDREPIAATGEVTPASAATARSRDLERELAITKDQLNAIIVEVEDANEDLQAANEELQSANEELQSANEELETSKEELQSTNEELVTLNTEVHSGITELTRANDDLHNILAGVDNAVMVVDMELRVRRYTPAAARLFELAPTDLGRSIEIVESVVAGVKRKVAAVLATLNAVDDEILAGNHHWYALRIVPYHSHDHHLGGAVITLSDIDVAKRARDLMRDVASYAEQFLGVIDHPLLIVDHRQRVVWGNITFFSRFQVVPEETIGSPLDSIGARQWAAANLHDDVEHTLATGRPFRDRDVRCRIDGVNERTMRIGGSRVPLSTGPPLAMLSIEELDHAAPSAAPS